MAQGNINPEEKAGGFSGAATRRRQADAQRQSQSPNRAGGLAGKTWSIESSHGRIFGKWKEAKSASSSDPAGTRRWYNVGKTLYSDVG